MLQYQGGLYRIAIVGGIASGKSHILKHLGRYKQIQTLDLDKLGHRILNFDPLVLQKIENVFGTSIFIGSGSHHSELEQQNFKAGKRELDRRELGNKVFKSKDMVGQISEIMWPAIS